MFKNYLKTALRIMKNEKMSAFINIAGLAIAVAVVIFIFLFIDYELGFDSNINNKENLFRVVQHYNTPSGLQYYGSNYYPLSAALRNDFPELTAVTQTNQIIDEPVFIDNQEFNLNLALFVEPDFYKMMQVKWIFEDFNRGTDPSSVILTESLSKKYFGSINSVGKRLSLLDSLEFTVTGIVADPPIRSSLPYEMLISCNAMKYFISNDDLSRWNYTSGTSQTYIQLSEARSMGEFEVLLDKFKFKYIDKDDFETLSFHLQQFKDIHFDAKYGSYSYITSRRTLWVLGSIGMLILIIACINFINLTTARALRRAKEIGIRKVLGANRKMLVFQLVVETAIFIIFSLFLGLIGVFSVFPFIVSHLNVVIDINRVFSGISLVFFLSLFLFLVGINSIYPAMVLSRYKPIEAFKSSSFGKSKKSTWMRNTLVFIQFTVTQILIVVTLIIAAQSRFIGKKDLGFKKEGILVVECPSYNQTSNESLRERWMQNPHIQDVSFAYSTPISENSINTNFQSLKNEDDTEYRIVMKPCDNHYINVYEIQLLAGSFFKNNVGNNDNPQWVVNEDVLKKIGISSPQESIGQLVKINGQIAPIIGVVKDFHTLSLHEKIRPVVLFNLWPRSNRYAHIKLDDVDLATTIKNIGAVWSNQYPNENFEYSFFDDELRMRYASTSRFLKLTQVATFLAIGLGCLGLLGLVSFVLVQKTKEIGIRKVLGASGASLYLHISRYFIKWILLANFISWPVAFWLSGKWLSGFAYRVQVGIGIFILGGIMVLGVALLVISFQVIKATATNPIKSLKYE